MFIHFKVLSEDRSETHRTAFHIDDLRCITEGSDKEVLITVRVGAGHVVYAVEGDYGTILNELNERWRGK